MQVLTEEEAKTKLCPITSYQGGTYSRERCNASECMLWEPASEVIEGVFIGGVPALRHGGYCGLKAK
jgi:hypothetical protein